MWELFAAEIGIDQVKLAFRGSQEIGETQGLGTPYA
jgi:hypothetical protein